MKLELISKVQTDGWYGERISEVVDLNAELYKKIEYDTSENLTCFGVSAYITPSFTVSSI